MKEQKMNAFQKFAGATVAALALVLTVGAAAPAGAVVTEQSGRPIGCC
jgi:hypothetical protein